MADNITLIYSATGLFSGEQFEVDLYAHKKYADFIEVPVIDKKIFNIRHIKRYAKFVYITLEILFNEEMNYSDALDDDKIVKFQQFLHSPYKRIEITETISTLPAYYALSLFAPNNTINVTLDGYDPEWINNHSAFKNIKLKLIQEEGSLG